MKNRTTFTESVAAAAMFMPAASSPSASKTPPATRRTASLAQPEIDSLINDLGDAGRGKCLHCGLPLARSATTSG